MLEFVAKLDFRHCDAELDRLIEEYKRARAALQGYLFREGFDLDVQPKSEEQQEAASGN